MHSCHMKMFAHLLREDVVYVITHHFAGQGRPSHVTQLEADIEDETTIEVKGSFVSPIKYDKRNAPVAIVIFSSMQCRHMHIKCTT